MDSPTPKNSLRDIGHLFLSGVRDRQTGGAPRPVRRPPQANGEAELSAEEFQQMILGQAGPQQGPSGHIGPVTAVIAPHLGSGQAEHARRYARQLAAAGTRVGLIELDVSEFRLCVFEKAATWEAPPEECAVFDHRAMVEALEEMSADVGQWVLLVANPRVPEARELLKLVDRWVLISACDHDGMVAAYRTLKGLSDLHRPEVEVLTIGGDTAQAREVFRKLDSVSRQFLSWPLAAHSMLAHVTAVAEHQVLACHTILDKPQPADMSHWQVVTAFMERARSGDLQEQAAPAEQQPPPKVQEPCRPAAQTKEMPVPAVTAAKIQPEPTVKDDAYEIVDLGEGDLAAAVIDAVLSHGRGELAECPVRPPSYGDARLAVGRDRRLTMLAVIRPGLAELGAAASAYQWMLENRSLIAMALPQFSIDPMQTPRLRLLVDQADAKASTLHPLLAGATVEVQTYRRVRWGQRTGLLLEAA